jgi:hypothetical protein
MLTLEPLRLILDLLEAQSGALEIDIEPGFSLLRPESKMLILAPKSFGLEQ